MGISDRILLIRNNNSLSQEEFGSKIGLSKFAISGYENGKRTITDRVIADICREFSVNEHWLRNGEDDMFKPQEDRFTAYLSEIDDSDDPLIRSIIEVYMELDEPSKKALRKIANEMAKKYIEKEQDE